MRQLPIPALHGPNSLILFSEVQCVLLGDLLLLLQKQDDKLVLKCQSKSNIAVQEGKQMLSPIIKLDSIFLRDVATGELHWPDRQISVTFIIQLN